MAETHARAATTAGAGSAPDAPADRHAEWKQVHQRYELDFHRGENFRWDDAAFMGQWDEVFGSFCGLRKDQFAAQDVIVDLGCGSRPAFDWFDAGCQKVHVDPLLDRYREIPQVARFWRHARGLLPWPAERFVPVLEGRCAFVNCWNVLDHTYDWRRILLNLWRYAREGGLVCLSTDLEPHGPGHPGIEDPCFFWEFLESHFEIEERREHYIHREVALRMRRR